MKRLFYTTNSLDDAEWISDEVHSMGITDHQFYVVCRDEAGIQTHHLHGSKGLENTQILSARKRSAFFAMIPTLIVCIGILLALEPTTENIIRNALISSLVFVVSRYFAAIACRSFDDYLKGVLDDKLDSGEVVVIIDVPKNMVSRVAKELALHPAASFVADSSNIASPIPA